MDEVIKVENLIKKYNSLIAVNQVSFSVRRGEVFGLLGENGAGKTTTLEIIEGLRQPNGGRVSILGHDVVNNLESIKPRIGVQLQSSAYFNFLTLHEILTLFGGFYPRCLKAEALLDMVDLQSKKKTYVNRLSGGQKQRFSIVASLVNDPEIVFLDEPTTGLDPLARRNLWKLIEKIKSKGRTIVLTTHYMDEAEILCDRVAVMDEGEIIALDETHKLVARTKYPFKITFFSKMLGNGILEKLKRLGPTSTVAGKEKHFEIRLKSQSQVNEALPLIHQLQPESLAIRQATLEDLFIEITGRNIEE